MKKKLSLFLLFLFVFVNPANVSAYLEDYSPFTGKKPRPFPLKELELGHGEGYKFSLFDDDKMRLEIVDMENNNDYSLLTVYDDFGNKRTEPVKIPFVPYVLHAYTADLNRDGKEDFVVQLGTVSNGLGMYKNPLVFALSSKAAYEITLINDWLDLQESPRKNFVSLTKNGRAQFVHTSLTFIENKRGNIHSYWIYNILEFRGSKLVLANQLHPIFPKCVWYTIKPNHKRSPIMTKAETLQWSEKNFPSFFWSDED